MKLIHGVSLAATACWLGCAAPEDLGQSDQDVRGTATYGSNCTAADIRQLDLAMHFGRVTSASPAFAACVERELAAYVPCSDDPIEVRDTTRPFAGRLAALLAYARTDTPIFASCAGAVGVAADATGAGEDYRWGRTELDRHVARAAMPVCGNPQACRPANGPWYEMAGTIWHEAVHGHDFRHDQQAPNLYECQVGDWANVYDHSVPQIFNRCMQEVIYQSGQQCGDRATCGARGLMIYSPATASCGCIEDPGPACWDNTDSDGDGRGNACDACPQIANESPLDGDADGRTDACDNCLGVANSSQSNIDNDLRGDACDNCRLIANNDQADGDADQVGDLCDNCATTWNRWQDDRDQDRIGDACDPDRDGDGILNPTDKCPDLASLNNADSDHDGMGDPCDDCDLTRGLVDGCKPLSQLLRLLLDDRMAAIAECFRDHNVGGPWGPWDPLVPCLWKCPSEGTGHQTRYQDAKNWIGAHPQRTPTEADIRTLLMREEGATKEAVDRFLRDRLAPL